MAPGVLIIGPRGCGKTLHAEALRQHFGCATVADDWHPSVGILPGALMLTYHQPGGTLPFVSPEFEAYEFIDAMRRMEAAHVAHLGLDK